MSSSSSIQEEENVQMSVTLKKNLRQLLQDVNDTHIKTVSGETAQDEMKRGFWTHLETCDSNAHDQEEFAYEDPSSLFG